MRKPDGRVVLRRVAIGLGVALLLATASMAHYAFLPWLPIKPGYRAHRFASGTVYVRRNAARAQGYAALDSIVAAVEQFHGIAFKRRVDIYVTSEWRQFNRGALQGWNGAPRPVLGAAMQTGDAIYVSPLAARSAPQGVLAHELCHALLYQYVGLRESFALHRERWLLEGLAVHVGNPASYLTDATFDSLTAAHPEWVVSIASDSAATFTPSELAGPFRLTEYRRFIAWLIERDGHPRLRRLIREAIATPSDVRDAFARTYATPLAVASEEFASELHMGRRRNRRPRSITTSVWPPTVRPVAGR